MFWVPLAVGAGLGLLKYGADAQKEKKDRELQAATARLSPWTGMHPGAVKSADLLGNVLQGGTAGAMFGQQFDGGGQQQPMAGQMGGFEDPNQMNPYEQMMGKKQSMYG